MNKLTRLLNNNLGWSTIIGAIIGAIIGDAVNNISVSFHILNLSKSCYKLIFILVGVILGISCIIFFTLPKMPKIKDLLNNMFSESEQLLKNDLQILDNIDNAFNGYDKGYGYKSYENKIIYSIESFNRNINNDVPRYIESCNQLMKDIKKLMSVNKLFPLIHPYINKHIHNIYKILKKSLIPNVSSLPSRAKDLRRIHLSEDYINNHVIKVTEKISKELSKLQSEVIYVNKHIR